MFKLHLYGFKRALNGAEAAAFAIIMVAVVIFFAQDIGLIGLINYAFRADARADAASRAFIIDKFWPVCAPRAGFISESCGGFYNYLHKYVFVRLLRRPADAGLLAMTN